MDDGIDPLTLPLPPKSHRPENGFIAWQVTLGYINTQHSPDARLKLEAYPTGKGILWQGTVSWSKYSERVSDQPSLPDVLRVLWLEVAHYHPIFETTKEANRPTGYADTEWLDLATQNVLHRLLWMVATAFNDSAWRLVLVYQPSEVPAQRVQTRLMLPSGTYVGGRGANLIESLRDCFRNAIPAFAEHLDDETISNEKEQTDNDSN